MLKFIVTLPITIYKWMLSPLLGRNCRYTPSCSTYMKQAVETHGVRKGITLGTKRFCKCHPWSNHYDKMKGYDPVPPSDKK